jgi:hypothetical protein
VFGEALVEDQSGGSFWHMNDSIPSIGTKVSGAHR